MPAGRVHLYDAAAAVMNNGEWFLQVVPFALEPDGSEPHNAAAYDLIVPVAHGFLPDRRYLANRLRYTNPAYRARVGLQPVHQLQANGAVPNFGGPEFASMVFDPCPVPAAHVVPPGGAAAAPVLPNNPEAATFS